MQYVIETKTAVQNLWWPHRGSQSGPAMFRRGVCMVFIGPNGAGKIYQHEKCCWGLGFTPTAGSVALLGRTLTERTRLELLRQTGSLIESPSGYLHLTAQENLEIVADLKGVSYKDIDRVLEIVHLQADRSARWGSIPLA